MEKITSSILQNGVSYVRVELTDRLDIFKTFDCGQSFRIDRVNLFGNKYEFGGVALGRYVVFAQNTPDELIIYNATEEDYKSIWRFYLALDCDYEEINNHISRVLKSSHMDKAIQVSQGIRILRQDRWESVCSFIISQNNNIPRIKKIIANMCEKYGESISFLGNTYYKFPTPEKLLEAGEEGIFQLKTGFRAKYIIDACRLIIDGTVSLDRVYEETDFDRCLNELCQIKGVGLKVASCALLFGFDKTEAFPIDVWMKRALEKYFPNGIDLQGLGKCAGIAQQYLFYYEKYIQIT
ncbi:MAG: DNA-3-methyladenine glycosylase 2 family protein [Clostridia bacterium]|nr:DNA-3-methyladenine glycosylase 2 family protein [Clostridia bacterium]